MDFKHVKENEEKSVLDKKENTQKDKNKINQIKQKNSNIKNNLPKTNISNSSIFLAVTSLIGFLYSNVRLPYPPRS